MTDTIHPIYLVSARVEVVAQGFWFTAGGEKGPFGYYPHLKLQRDDHLLPYYPDTQIMGDWRMACTWLSKLSPTDFPDDRVEWLFGKKGAPLAGRLNCNDLELVDETNIPGFVVRTRCGIENISRVNKEHMLVSREYAWLDKRTLSADMVLGYFSNEDEIELAKNMLAESAYLLSGFGAFRSRGCGRGCVSLKDWQFQKILPPENPIIDSNTTGHYLYALEAKSNFRNKRLNPARTQLLVSEKKISNRQIAAWFVRTYHWIYYDRWPDIKDMACLKFSTIYPSIKTADTVIPAYPPAFSTIRYEDGTILDSPKKPEDEQDGESHTMHGKAKPLAQDMFVTNTASPGIFQVKTEQRFRNAIDNNFSTKETRGLFTQELICQGTWFAGYVTITPVPGKEAFASQAKWIIENIPPVISGTFFSPMLRPGPIQTDCADVHLLIEPLHFSKENAKSFTQYRLGIIRSYNTMLKRPRQNRIVYEPGSLMSTNVPVAYKSIPWKGHEQTINTASVNPMDKEMPPDVPSSPQKLILCAAIKNLSRSQMGNLRMLIEMDLPLIVTYTSGILNKYDKWNMDKIPENLIPKKILEDIRDMAGKGDRTLLRDYVHLLRQEYARHQWTDQQKKYVRDSVKMQKG